MEVGSGSWRAPGSRGAKRVKEVLAAPRICGEACLAMPG
jgi:hypothetical protein